MLVLGNGDGCYYNSVGRSVRRHDWLFHIPCYFCVSTALHRSAEWQHCWFFSMAAYCWRYRHDNDTYIYGLPGDKCVNVNSVVDICVWVCFFMNILMFLHGRLMFRFGNIIMFIHNYVPIWNGSKRR